MNIDMSKKALNLWYKNLAIITNNWNLQYENYNFNDHVQVMIIDI